MARVTVSSFITLLCCVFAIQGNEDEVAQPAESQNTTSSCVGTEIHVGDHTFRFFIGGDYSLLTNCEWTVTGSLGNHMLISLDDVDMTQAYGCQYESLTVLDLKYSSPKWIGRVCGSKCHESFFLVASHRVKIIYRTDPSTPYRRRRIPFSIALTNVEKGLDIPGLHCACANNEGCISCGNADLSGSTGKVISHNYPNPYPNDMQCTWVIENHNELTIELIIEIEVANEPDCDADRLTILGSSADSFSIPCIQGSAERVRWTSNSKILLIEFTSSPNNKPTWTGFSIDFHTLGVEDTSSTETICSGEFLTAPIGTITSPSFPLPYLSNLECSWKIEVEFESDQVLHMKFHFMEIESSPNCQHDSLTLQKGDSSECADETCDTYCGVYAPFERTYETSVLHIHFKSDSKLNFLGFIFTYSSLRNQHPPTTSPPTTTATESDAHGGAATILTANTGEIHSPSYPNNYPGNSEHTWRIEGNPDQKISLTSLEFHLEYSRTCKFDNITINAGFSHDCPQSPPHDCSQPPYDCCVYCGPLYEPFNVIIPNHRASIKFMSDSLYSYTGFRIQYEILGGSNVDTASDIENQDDTASGVVSGEQYTRPTNINCGMEQLPKGEGTLMSPNFPNNYPNYAACVWIIDQDSWMVTEVHIEEAPIVIEYHTICLFDHLTVFDGQPGDCSIECVMLCGKYENWAWTSTSSIIALEFVTDQVIGTAGFSLSYSAMQSPSSSVSAPTCFESISGTYGCENMCLTESDGQITSPNFPNRYPVNLECRWTISVASNEVINLLMEEMDIETHSSCKYDNLTIYDGMGNSCDGDRCTIAILCARKDNYLLQTNTSLVTLVFRSDDVYSYKGFNITYYTNSLSIPATTLPPTPDPTSFLGNYHSSSVCGTTVFHESEGTIYSPGFQEGNNYPNNIICYFAIIGQPGQIVTLTIEEITVEYAEDCRFDSVSIYDGRPEDCSNPDRHCFTICGSESLDPFVASTHILMFVFKSDDLYNRKGFKATYTVEDEHSEYSGHSGGCNPTDPAFEVVSTHPWVAAIWKDEHFVCSGSIISDSWILTPADCVTDVDGSYSAVYGVDEHTPGPITRHPIIRVTIHPDYDDVTGVDLAVVKLRDTIIFNLNVSPICLTPNYIEEGTYCSLVGWSDSAINPGLVTDLQEVMVPLLEVTECEQSGSCMQNDCICAGYPHGGINTCFDDPGRHLICNQNNVNYLRGINNIGPSCIVPGSPVSYTDVTSHYTWIMNSLAYDEAQQT